MAREYRILSPGGNDTALVLCAKPNATEAQRLCREIMSRHDNVEQVGFFSQEGNTIRLEMAGGEFCGNAARCAAWYALGGKSGEVRLSVSGAEETLRGGVSENGEAWVKMPLSHGQPVQELAAGLFLVRLPGISHLIVLLPPDEPFDLNESKFKAVATDMLKRHGLIDEKAAGVVYVDNIADRQSIHPCIHVADVSTLICESACGSGTVAAGLVAAFLGNCKEINFRLPRRANFSARDEGARRGGATPSDDDEAQGNLDKRELKFIDEQFLRRAEATIPFAQPSGKTIHAVVSMTDGQVTTAKISGEVTIDANRFFCE